MTFKAPTFPLSLWPEPYRAIGADIASRGRSACASFLRFSVAHGIDPAFVDEGLLLSWLDDRFPPKAGCGTRCRVLLHIFRMLTDAHPNRDYAWIRHRSARESPYVRTGGQRGLPRTCSLPPKAWPIDWQTRWSEATDHVLSPSTTDKWARLRLSKARPWRKTYARNVRDSLGMWAWAMREAHQSAEMTPGGLQCYIDMKRERGGLLKSIASDLKKLAAGLDVVMPCGAPPYLRKTARSLRGRAQHEDPPSEISPTEHPAVLAAIGLLLIARARTLPRGSHQAIRLFHDGALIYTLAFRPLRVASVVAIRIGQELKLAGAAVGRLCLPAAAMKAKKQWGVDLNSDLSDILREWVSDYRRFLTRSTTSPYLFISRQPSRTGALTTQGVGDIVRRWTLAYLGRSLSPHDFRHAAGTMLLDEFPDQPWIGSAILQHSDPKTLATYSKGHDTLGASDQFGRIVDLAKKRAQSLVGR